MTRSENVEQYVATLILAAGVMKARKVDKVHLERLGKLRKLLSEYYVQDKLMEIEEGEE